MIYLEFIIKHCFFLDPAEPQILVDVKAETFEALSLDAITYDSSPPQPPPPVLSSTTYPRSKSNLDQVYYGHLAKQERETIIPDTDRTNTQKTKKVQKLSLQRQSSCKEVPEKISKNNAIRHSVSEMNINKSTTTSRVSSRKNSFSKSGGYSSSLQKIQQTPMRPVDRDRTNIPVPLSSSTPIVDIYVSPKISPETSPEDEETFVPALPDEAYGLNINDFLPVNMSKQGLTRKYFVETLSHKKFRISIENTFLQFC